MKLFIAGDYWSCTGPANVTQSLIQGSNPQIIYQHTRNKIFRVIEILYKTSICDAVVYSGFSLQNLVGFKLAKIFHRPSFYLMHGSIFYEGLINEDSDSAMMQQEQDMLKLADFILAVSKPFEEWLKNQYPHYSNKIYTLTNGIDWKIMESHSKPFNKISGQLLSIGGGMPRKNILSICQAIELIYKSEPKCTIKLLVLGAPGRDSNAIQQYHFVEDHGLVSHEDALAYMGSSQLYIQNSSFETFGLAPVEALLQGCSLLITPHAGVSSIITTLEDKDLISNTDNIEELKDKILYTLQNPNSTRLLKGIDPASTSTENRQYELISLTKELGNIKH